MSGEQRYERHAVGVLRLLYPLALRHPHGFGHLLRAVDFYLAPVKEVVIVGPADGQAELLRVVRSQFRPHVVLAGSASPEQKRSVSELPAAFVCEHFVCQAPVTEPDELAALLG